MQISKNMSISLNLQQLIQIFIVELLLGYLNFHYYLDFLDFQYLNYHFAIIINLLFIIIKIIAKVINWD